jgi:hypothetical protein
MKFVQLNRGWNAEPNAPHPRVCVEGRNLVLRFVINTFRFPQFKEDDEATVRFFEVERYRLGPTNDEGWYSGECRFSALAPAWGEFYEISGEQRRLLAPADWRVVGESRQGRHFLFYFRDETFECVAQEWSVDLPPCS